MPPITPVSTIPHPETISEALRELDVSEPRTLDPSRWARVGSEVIPLPPVPPVLEFNAQQTRGDVHPLTCGNSSRHKPLRMIEDGSLVCDDCDYTQDFPHWWQPIPPFDWTIFGVAEATTSLESEDDAE